MVLFWGVGILFLHIYTYTYIYSFLVSLCLNYLLTLFFQEDAMCNCSFYSECFLLVVSLFWRRKTCMVAEVHSEGTACFGRDYSINTYLSVWHSTLYLTLGSSGFQLWNGDNRCAQFMQVSSVVSNILIALRAEPCMEEWAATLAVIVM